MSASLYAVVDPSTGETVKEYPTATDQQIEAAIAAATKAHREWSRGSTVADRAALIRKVAELHTERKDELAKIINREMGKPMDDAVGEVDFSAAIYEYYADNAEKFLADEPIDLLDGEGTALIRRSSLGVLLGIMPWNYPDYQVARFAGPNLTLGNTILLKHAPQCPESAAAIAADLRRRRLPRGRLRQHLRHQRAGRASIIADPRVQGVSLTGSERAGAAVAEIAGRNLKKVVLELGGSDPFIVLELRRPRRHRRGRGRRPLREHRAGVQRRQAVHRRRGPLRRLPRQVHREDARKAEGLAPLSSVAAAERLDEQVERAVATAPRWSRAASATAPSSPPAC